MNDIGIEALRDIELNNDSTLKVLDQIESIGRAIIRRLSTPVDGYERVVQLQDGSYRVLDRNYGSGLYGYLSQPMTELDNDTVLQTIRSAVSIMEDVEIISLTKVRLNYNQIGIQLNYRINGLDNGSVVINV